MPTRWPLLCGIRLIRGPDYSPNPIMKDRRSRACPTSRGARPASFQDFRRPARIPGHRVPRGRAMSRNWIIGAAIAGGAFLVNSVMQADRGDSGAIVDAGSVDAFQMRVGDCFDDGSTFADQEVNSVPGVPCANPHDNEVYAVYDVAMAEFPGEEMAGMAHTGC